MNLKNRPAIQKLISPNILFLLKTPRRDDAAPRVSELRYKNEGSRELETTHEPRRTNKLLSNPLHRKSETK